MIDAKVIENKLRRRARRQGYRLQKSKRRDPDAFDFGGYMLVDAYCNTAVFGAAHYPYSASLHDVESFLNEGRPSAYVQMSKPESGSEAAGPNTRYCVRCDLPGPMAEMRPLREVEHRIVDGAHCYLREGESAYRQDEPELWAHHACVRKHTFAKNTAGLAALAAGAREMARAESDKPVAGIKRVRLLLNLADAATPLASLGSEFPDPEGAA